MTAPRVSVGAAPTGKRRDSKLWSETFDVKLGAMQPLSPKEIKRQEVRGKTMACVSQPGFYSFQRSLKLGNFLRLFSLLLF